MIQTMKLNYGVIRRAELASGLVKHREVGKNTIPIIMLEGERGKESDIKQWVKGHRAQSGAE